MTIFFCPLEIQAYLPLQMLRCTSKGSTELMGLGFMFRLCISAGAHPALGCGWVLLRDGRVSGPLLQEISKVSSPQKAPGGVQPCLGQGGVIPQFPSQALSWSKSRREGKSSCLQSQPCSAQVWQAGHLCGGQQHHNCTWPILEGKSLCLLWHDSPTCPPPATLNISGTILGAPSGWVNQAPTKLLLPPPWPPDWKHLSSSQTNI